MAPKVLSIAFAQYYPAGIQDKYVHTLQYHPACLANSTFPPEGSSYEAFMDNMLT